MNTKMLLPGIAAAIFALSPQVAVAGKKASESLVRPGLSVSTSSEHNVPHGRAKEKKKFPPGLIDKCSGEDRPGRHGLDRACAFRSGGAN